MPGVPVLLIRCDRLSAHQAEVLRGPVERSDWRHLGSSVDAPPEVQALPLPVLRVLGQILTSIQSRCMSHSVLKQFPHRRSQVPI